VLLATPMLANVIPFRTRLPDKLSWKQPLYDQPAATLSPVFDDGVLVTVFVSAAVGVGLVSSLEGDDGRVVGMVKIVVTPAAWEVTAPGGLLAALVADEASLATGGATALTPH